MRQEFDALMNQQKILYNLVVISFNERYVILNVQYEYTNVRVRVRMNTVYNI